MLLVSLGKNRFKICRALRLLHAELPFVNRLLQNFQRNALQLQLVTFYLLYHDKNFIGASHHHGAAKFHDDLKIRYKNPPKKDYVISYIRVEKSTDLKKIF